MLFAEVLQFLHNDIVGVAWRKYVKEKTADSCLVFFVCLFRGLAFLIIQTYIYIYCSGTNCHLPN